MGLWTSKTDRKYIKSLRPDDNQFADQLCILVKLKTTANLSLILF